MREQALKWWRGLTEEDKEKLAEKWFPNYNFVAVTTSSSRIEEIYKLEGKW